MICDAGACAGDQVAYTYRLNLRSNFNHNACRRIAQRKPGIQQRGDAIEGALNPVFAHRLKNPLNMLGLLDSTPVKRESRHLQTSRFRAYADTGMRNPNQYVLW